MPNVNHVHLCSECGDSVSCDKLECDVNIDVICKFCIGHISSNKHYKAQVDAEVARVIKGQLKMAINDNEIIKELESNITLLSEALEALWDECNDPGRVSLIPGEGMFISGPTRQKVHRSLLKIKNKSCHGKK